MQDCPTFSLSLGERGFRARAALGDDVIIATIKIVDAVCESVNGSAIREWRINGPRPSDVRQTTCHVVPNARYVIGVARARARALNYFG